MRNSRLERTEENMNRLIDAVRIQLEDLSDDQLDRLINLLTFERIDRDKNLQELTDLNKDE
jgi:hypothetical protein